MKSSLAFCAALSVTAAMSLGLTGCQSSQKDADQHANVASSAKKTHPLTQGQTAPSAIMLNLQGLPVSMQRIYETKPTVLVFYRGGWCPYCNTQLSELAKIERYLNRMGFQVVAVSPDRPEAMRESMQKNNVNYTLLSDSDIQLASAFGLAFEVDKKTRQKYQEYGIDLQRASGNDHHSLPVPAVYLIDTQGKIHFAFSDPDYKVRLDSQELLNAAEKMQRSMPAKQDQATKNAE